MKFAIAIEAGSDATAYGVAVPDLPGCFSAGDTVEEAFDNAVEAIEAYVETLAEGGKAIPETRSLSEWQRHKEYKGWSWGIVDVPVEKLFGPAEKINITVPALLLKRIDAYADKSGKTRSGFLAEAAVRLMVYEVNDAKRPPLVSGKGPRSATVTRPVARPRHK
jgi:predicted RNase H-like HicB family nuclease